MKPAVLISVGVGVAVLSTAGYFFIGRQSDIQPNQQHSLATSRAADACPDPLTLVTPVDTSLVTAVLWPGQVRGGDLKAHGGFRFDASRPNDIAVVAPLDARLTDASRYLEQGQEQYLLFFSSPCGLQYRFDHVRTLSPKLAAALKDLPPARPDDSRTTSINALVEVAAGEEITHSVGISASNVFVDFGLYKESPDSTNGLCFFDYLPPDDSAYLRSLPAGNEGKQSNYCRPYTY